MEGKIPVVAFLDVWIVAFLNIHVTRVGFLDNAVRLLLKCHPNQGAQVLQRWDLGVRKWENARLVVLANALFNLEIVPVIGYLSHYLPQLTRLHG